MKLASPVTAPWGLLRSMLACAALACLGACGGGGADIASTDANGEGDRATALATTVYQVTTKDKFAYASFYERTNFCEEFAVEVFANESRIRWDGATSSSQAYVRAQLTKYDQCTGVWTFMSGYTETDDIRIRHDLAQATALATVEMSDEFGNVKTLVFDLGWNGGVLAKDKFKWVIVTPLTRTLIKSDSQLRVSETITGALVLDGADLLAIDRLAEVRYTQGYVVSSGGLFIDITRSR